MSGPSSTLLRAAGLIIYKGNWPNCRYLLLQTSYGIYHWTPPKGHLDLCEQPFTAAVRETEEEAGLRLDIDYKVHEDFCDCLNYEVTSGNGTTTSKEVTYWLAKAHENAEVKLSHEHQDFAWLSLTEACEKAKFELMIASLHRVDAFLKHLTETKN